MNWIGVPSEKVADVWAAVEPLVDSALRHAIIDASSEALRREVEEQKAQLWLLREDEKIVGCVVTQLMGTDAGLECIVLVAAGEKMLSGVVALIDGVVSEWAKENGCVGISSLARRGWERRVPRSWRTTHVVVRKELKR